MLLTRHNVGQKLADNLQHRLSREDLVDWAEQAMMEADFDDADLEVLRRIVGRIGVSNVMAFGLTWEECEEYLSQLGYRVNVEVIEQPVMT